MSRITKMFFTGMTCLTLTLCGRAATADFLIGQYGFSELVTNGGIGVRTFTGGSEAETYDAFALSADGQQNYRFGNNLGFVVTDAWNVHTGAYIGAVGPQYFIWQNPPPNLWPDGILPNFAVGAPQTRAQRPPLGGDLLYAAFLPSVVDPMTGIPGPPGTLVDVIDTSAHTFTSQIVPPIPSIIRDFALGPGLLGPKSRAYLATNHGLFVFEEAQVSGPMGGLHDAFQPVSPTPLISDVSSWFDLDVGPDGLLYVLGADGAQSSIKRYNTSTGALVDTFLTKSQYNSDLLPLEIMKFGPDGSLYIAADRPQPDPQPAKLMISQFNVSTGQRQSLYDLGGWSIFDFFVLPVPEPSSVVLAICGAASLLFVRLRAR